MTSTTRKDSYESYQEYCNQLCQLAKNQYGLLQELEKINQNVIEHKENLLNLINRLEKNEFRVLVVGRFRAGKSTFINALFGQAVLPASPTPTTGVLCEIRFSDDNGKKAILHPKKGMGKNGNDAPFEINISNLTDELKKYIKINFSDNGQETSRYQKLELYWSLPMLQHGVELIDSVGLDDPDSRDEITLGYAKTADAIIYCIYSLNAFSLTDKEALSMFKDFGHESIFFIITHYDYVLEYVSMGETTEDEFRRGMNKNLVQWTELKEKGIHYIDSKTALLGKIHKDEEKIVFSGINEVLTALEDFLVEEKWYKLLVRLRTFRSINRSIRQVIIDHRLLLENKAKELEYRYNNYEKLFFISATESNIQLMQKKLKHLEKSLILEVDVNVKFKLEEDIYELKLQIENKLIHDNNFNLTKGIVEEISDIKYKIKVINEIDSRNNIFEDNINTLMPNLSST